MRIPIFLISFFILCIYVKVKIIKSTKEDKKSNKAFWDREEKAMFVRKKSLENLNYILINKNDLPIFEKSSCCTEIYNIQNKVLNLLEHKIVNLNGKTNTDLKMEYGTANLDTLITYENNYNILVRNLYKWGKLLHESNKIDEAIQVLETGVNINTDISNHYILLGKLYKTKKDTESFNSLYSHVNETRFILKDKILNALSSL
ncbi:hypothetical protein SH1V18_45680 [Vallitalea longa]|uniref:Uncharacterized protein n=1 Tax=Vallitalea longa TaxID=2936439 RepID=A0A9W6DI35_9FIRM|nr:hypothetical protein [Vallitalea longa]GKX32088.1 hypothetical protein SH1V18_45680 [Vallitalea longa]